MSFRNTISLLVSTVGVFMSRIKKSQMMEDLYNNAGKVAKEISYRSAT